MLSRIAYGLLWLGGWTVVGQRPEAPQAVLIAAPHTSNWDGIWGLIAKVAIGFDHVRFFGKQSLFWFPLGNVLRALGGIPLNREQAGGAVAQAVALFESGEPLLFGLSPEGTRKKTDHWKTGFYRIAMRANVPVVIAGFDYANRRVVVGETIPLTGDPERDLDRMRPFFDSMHGRHPEKAGDIRFIGDPLA